MLSDFDFEQLNLNMLYHQFCNMQLQCLAITSSGKGEGKTTITYGLTTIAVKDKKRVLVIDLDCINPTLTHELNKEPSHQNEWQNWLPEATHVDGLYLLPAPQNQQLIFKLSNKQTLSTLISQHAAAFDQIWIDCPAINQPKQNSIPSSLIAAAAPAVALVIMSSRTIMPHLEQAVTLLHKEKANLIGAIMNDKHCPGILSELIRETHRLDKSLPTAATKLRNFLQNQAIFKVDL